MIRAIWPHSAGTTAANTPNTIVQTSAIRASAGPNASTPIIALTANALGHHREAWESVGVAAFLTKPINPELLVETLLIAAAECANRAGEAQAA